jgi:hypothetical protein
LLPRNYLGATAVGDEEIRGSGKRIDLGDTENNYLVSVQLVADALLQSEDGLLKRRWCLPRFSALGSELPDHFTTHIDPTPNNHAAHSGTIAIMGVPFEALLPYGIMIGVSQFVPCMDSAPNDCADVHLYRLVHGTAPGPAERRKEDQTWY